MKIEGLGCCFGSAGPLVFEGGDFVNRTFVYDINGREYNFILLTIDGGVKYGFCKRLGKHAWLYDGYIQFENGHIQRAKFIEERIM